MPKENTSLPSTCAAPSPRGAKVNNAFWLPPGLARPTPGALCPWTMNTLPTNSGRTTAPERRLICVDIRISCLEAVQTEFARQRGASRSPSALTPTASAGCHLSGPTLPAIRTRPARHTSSVIRFVLGPSRVWHVAWWARPLVHRETVLCLFVCTRNDCNRRCRSKPTDHDCIPAPAIGLGRGHECCKGAGCPRTHPQERQACRMVGLATPGYNKLHPAVQHQLAGAMARYAPRRACAFAGLLSASSLFELGRASPLLPRTRGVSRMVGSSTSGAAHTGVHTAARVRQTKQAHAPKK